MKSSYKINMMFMQNIAQRFFLMTVSLKYIYIYIRGDRNDICVTEVWFFSDFAL